MRNKNSLFGIPLFLLNTIGLHPHRFNFSKSFIRFVLYNVLALNLLLYLVFKWQGLNSLNDTSIFISIFQIIVKMSTLMSHRKKFSTVLKIIETRFWKPNKYGLMPELEIFKTNRFTKRIMIISIFGYSVAVFVYFLRPFVSETKTAPASVYFPSDLSKMSTFWIAYSVQGLTLVLIAMPALFGFDLLFIALIVYLVNEFKLIKHGFVNIKVGENGACCLKEIHDLIDHHNVVLKCIKLLTESYSLLLLNQFLTSLFIMCSCLLSIITQGFPPPLPRILQSAPYLIAFSSMMFLYCFGGTLLTKQSEEVAHAAYESKWWMQTQPEFRKSVAMVIQRANKIEKLTAGGIVNLKLESFTQVVNNAVSLVMLAHLVWTRSFDQKFNKFEDHTNTSNVHQI